MGTTASIPQETATIHALPNAWRVELFRKRAADDPDGKSLTAAARELGLAGLQSARMGRGYLLPPSLEREALEQITRELLADPLLDEVRIIAPGKAPPACADTRVLVARKIGVMDPVADTVQQALDRAGLAPAGLALEISTFRAWELHGTLSAEDLNSLAARVLFNDTIESVTIGGEGLSYGESHPKASFERVQVDLLDADHNTLVEISKRGALSLNLAEMQAIQSHFQGLGRNPSACELETLAQTWSEHCKHKTFAAIVELDGRRIDNLLKQTIKSATHELDRDWCISVFHDNAGIIAFDGDWDICFKVETHNHPSAIDPYGGAGTGIGGVIRDILGVGLGAKPIAGTDAFFVGPADLAPEDLPPGCMHPRRILRGVIAGVRDYGNRMGIPTVNGGVWFDEGFVGNPLVYAGTVGLIPRWAATKSVQPGDKILVVGGRTGRDGIHGATFSSLELHEESEMVSAAAVQIGDPVTEKRVLDALLTARDKKLYRSITDCGAGGLSSAVGEMGAECGARVDLELVPLKYQGLSPEEIWISEAQERMVLAVPPEDLSACIAVFEAEDVEATCIGHFDDSGHLRLYYEGAEMCDIEMEFLHDGTPRPVRQASWSPPAWEDPGAPRAENPGATLLELLARPNISSREWIVRQYDHEVQGTSVLKPLVGVKGEAPGDGAVIRPLEDSFRGVAITCGANPRYGRLHPGRMALAVIDEALRNSLAVGGNPTRTAILDNFSWGNCERPEQLGALVLAAEACREAALAYGTPFISGKDSLNNEYRVGDHSQAIPPTLLISALSVVSDVRRTVSMDLKCAGNLIYQVGLTRAELGGSEYLAILGLEGGVVPAPDLGRAPALFANLHLAMEAGLVRACHDLSEGGLAVAAAEMAFGGGLGLDLDIACVPTLPLAPNYDATATALFSEACTRFLVEIAPEDQTDFEVLLDDAAFALVGRVRADDTFEVRGADGAVLIQLPLSELADAHRCASRG